VPKPRTEDVEVEKKNQITALWRRGGNDGKRNIECFIFYCGTFVSSSCTFPWAYLGYCRAFEFYKINLGIAMSLSPICIRDLLASRGLPSRCACPRCREAKEHEEAIDYYRKDLNPGPREYDVFPEKEGI